MTESEYCVDYYELRDFIDKQYEKAMKNMRDSPLRSPDEERYSGAAWAFNRMHQYIGEYEGNVHNHE